MRPPSGLFAENIFVGGTVALGKMVLVPSAQLYWITLASCMDAWVLMVIGKGKDTKMRSLRLGMVLVVLSGVFVGSCSAAAIGLEEVKQSKEVRAKAEKAAVALVGLYDFLEKHPDKKAEFESKMKAAQEQKEALVEAPKAEASKIERAVKEAEMKAAKKAEKQALEAKKDELYTQQVDGPWACPACTYENNQNANVCLMCNTERPKKPIVDLGFGTMRKRVIAFKQDIGGLIRQRNGNMGYVMDLGLWFDDGTLADGKGGVGIKPISSFKFLTKAEQQGHNCGDWEADEKVGVLLTKLRVKKPGKAELKNAGLVRFIPFFDDRGGCSLLVERPVIVFVIPKLTEVLKEHNLLLVQRSGEKRWQYVRVLAPRYYVKDVRYSGGSSSEHCVAEGNVVSGDFYSIYQEDAFGATDSASRQRALKEAQRRIEIAEALKRNEAAERRGDLFSLSKKRLHEVQGSGRKG
jgi:hypothetical protein